MPQSKQPAHRKSNSNETFSKTLEAPNKRRRIAVRATLGAAGVALAGGILLGTNHEENKDFFKEVGFTPSPAVSSASTEALIGLNDTLRDFGPYGLGLGITLGAAHLITRRQPGEDQFDAMHKITHQDKRIARIAFTGTVMGIVASASGLGDTAGQGANEPVRVMAEMLGADKSQTPIITSYANTPYNDSVIDYPRIATIIDESGGTAVPFLQVLGKVEDPTATSNPSSAPIFAVPNAVLEQSLGVSLPEVQDCDDMAVIVGEQLGVSEDDIVSVNDRLAHVAKTIDIKPGLDRVAVVGSLEQISKCIYPDLPMTGAVALGLDGKQAELEQKIRDTLGLPYAVRSFDEFQEKYEEFWDRSVKPPEMNLILDALLLGGIAIGYMQKSEISARRKNIAMLLSQGVAKKHVARAYNIAAQEDTLLGVPFAVLTSAALTRTTNASQYGLEQAVDLAAIGAGYSTLAGVALATALVSNHVIKKTDVAAQLRSGV